MFRKLFSVLALVLAAVLIHASSKADTFTLSRSVLVNAPAAKVYPLVSDLRAFNTWNPFLAQEPSAKLSYEGAATGKGSAYTWTGDKTGQGRMEITDTTAPSRVAVKLDFIKPFAAQNQAEFLVQPKGDNPASTQVTWTMSGPLPFWQKVMTTFFSMDRMVGGEFEKGLASLKTLAEKP